MVITHEPLKIEGQGISGGMAKGKLRFLKHREISESDTGAPLSPEEELSRLASAIEKAQEQLSELYTNTANSVGEKEAEIFRIHSMLLDDEEFKGAAENFISQGMSAVEAVRRAGEAVAGMFRELGDDYLAGRAQDIKFITERLCRILTGNGEYEPDMGEEPFILVSDDLSPGETVKLDRRHLLGFVTFGGSSNSHTAILARALGLPALIGTGKIDEVYDGETAIIDAERGELIISPGIDALDRFAEEVKEKEAEEARLRSLIGRPTVTRSGRRIKLYANIGSPEESDVAYRNDAEGVGLMRSEFLYLSASDYPDEETQFAAYREAVAGMHGRPVVIRTLDIGADKKADYFALPEEENPALGMRAIRLCLSRPEVFKTQLRAICRASAFGKVLIMLPMIVSVDEVRQAKRIFVEVRNELRYECLDFDEDIRLGVMIETPASAVMSEELAREVDFFSVGTNDLIQYTLAADRQNPALEELCRDNLEPVMRLIETAAEAAHANGKWIGVCGELAADLSLTERFVAMGIDELSVSPPAVLPLREKILGCR